LRAGAGAPRPEIASAASAIVVGLDLAAEDAEKRRRLLDWVEFENVFAGRFLRPSEASHRQRRTDAGIEEPTH